MGKNQKITRDTGGANYRVAKTVAILFVMFLMGLAVKGAFGQNLPDGANKVEFESCVGELRAINQTKNMWTLRVGDSLFMPECANGGLFDIVTADSAMVRAFGGWGIVFKQRIGRFPTEQEFANRELPKAGTGADSTSTGTETASLPWWMNPFAIFLCALAIAILLIASGIHVGEQSERRRNTELQRRTPTPVGGTTDEEVLRTDSFSEHPVTERAIAGDSFQRYVAPRAGADWVVLYETIQQVFLNGGPIMVRFWSRLNSSEYTRSLIFRDTPAWRGTLRNTKTRETREALALAQCFNEPVSMEGVRVTDQPIHPPVNEPDPLVGTTATVTAVERGDNGAVQLTLEHPTVGVVEANAQTTTVARRPFVTRVPRAE